MAEFRPFNGLRYDAEKNDLAKVTAPPYDVISDDERDDFLKLDENNVVKLILGKMYDSDDENNNRYTRAKDVLNEWTDKGVLIKDEKKYYYLLKQEYENKYGEKKATYGIITEVKLHPWSEGVILPHERTLSKPKADRLNLVKETKANLSPIYLLYEDDKKELEGFLKEFADKNAPFGDFNDSYGVRNILWQISEDEGQKIADFFKERTMYIADGHHRYETMVAYRDIRRGETGVSEGADFDYAMMYTTVCSEDNLTVYPTHRLLFDLNDEQIQSLPEKLKEDFNVEEIAIDGDKLKGRDELLKRMNDDYDNHSFGLLIKGDNKYYRFTLKDKGLLQTRMPDDTEEVRNLDVSILHTIVIERILGLDKEKQAAQTNIKYTRDDDYAVTALDSGDFQATFFVNPTALKSIIRISDESSIMPQKSTYFYPKLPSGLVFRVME